MNSVNLTGRLTKDIELRTSQSGNTFTSFTIAVRGFRDAQGNEQTNFIPCNAWNGKAEFLSKYSKKGDMLEITGSIQVRTYQTQQGENRTIIEVVVDSVSNLTPKPKETIPNPNSPVKVNGQGVDFTPDDDLPF
jgi:single-strand DNA-binding protein